MTIPNIPGVLFIAPIWHVWFWPCSGCEKTRPPGPALEVESEAMEKRKVLLLDVLIHFGLTSKCGSLR